MVGNCGELSNFATHIQMQLIGTIEAKVDQKGRVFMPASFRKALAQSQKDSARGLDDSGKGQINPAQSQKDSGKGLNDPARSQKDTGAKDGELRLVMRKDVFERCLVLYPEGVWNERLEQLRSRLSVWRRRDQEMLRSYVSDAEWITLDSNGRLLIPKRYLQMADIQSEVTFVGMNDTVEVWATPSFRQMQSRVDIADGIEEAMG